MVVIDTSVFIAWEREGQEVDIAAHVGSANAAVSAITVSELLVGIYRGESELRRQHRAKYVATVLRISVVLAFNEPIARLHAELHAQLLMRGQVIGAHDLLIAATARHHDAAVLTADVADFSRVPGLDVVDFGT